MDSDRTSPLGDLVGLRAFLSGVLSAGVSPHNPSVLATRVSILESSLDEYESTGNRDELEFVIAAAREALPEFPSVGLFTTHMLLLLGRALRFRSRDDQSIVDIDEAIAACEAAVIASDFTMTDISPYLSEHASALLSRYEMADQIADLHAALDVVSRALAASLDPDDSAPRVANLMNVLHHRVRVLGADTACLGYLALVDSRLRLWESRGVFVAYLIDLALSSWGYALLNYSPSHYGLTIFLLSRAQQEMPAGVSQLSQLLGSARLSGVLDPASAGRIESDALRSTLRKMGIEAPISADYHALIALMIDDIRSNVVRAAGPAGELALDLGFVEWSYLQARYVHYDNVAVHDV